MLDALLEALVRRGPVALTVLGVVVLAFCGAGGIPFGPQGWHPFEPNWRLGIGAVGTIIAGLGIFLLIREHPEGEAETKFDLFFAYPMAAWDDAEMYKKERDAALQIVAALHGPCKVKTVYYAGQAITSTADFDENDVAAEENLEALRNCGCFLMVYPGRMVSSVLFEAGYALALKKNSIYFVRRIDDLPYIMKKAHTLSGSAFPRVKIYEYQDADHLIRLLPRLIPRRRRRRGQSKGPRDATS